MTAPPDVRDDPSARFSPADEHAMRQALDQAQNAWLVGEVPVGAVIVRDDAQGVPQVVATGYNRPITTHDPTAHAELVALRHAAQLAGNYRLPDCTLYVTLEPCAMCAMALMHARFKRVVFGAFDPKTGAAGSVVDLFGIPQLNHHTTLEGGCLGDTCGQALRAFFAERRALQKAEQAERRAAAGGTLPGDGAPRGGDVDEAGPGDDAGATAANDVVDSPDDVDELVPDRRARPRIDLAANDPDVDPADGLPPLLPVGEVEEVEVLPVGFAIEVDPAPPIPERPTGPPRR